MPLRGTLEGDGPWGVGEVSAATGVAMRTLQRWHDRNIARASDRTHGGARRYHRGDVFRVVAIETIRKRTDVGARNAGLLLDDLRAALQIAMGGTIALRFDESSAQDCDRAL